MARHSDGALSAADDSFIFTAASGRTIYRSGITGSETGELAL
jgi:hypothetical protein